MCVKKQRIVDPALLALVRTLPCLACLPIVSKPSQPHHVTSVGAGGDDVPENLMPLCPEHHSMWHQSGPGYMVREFPVIRSWLEEAGRRDVLERSDRSIGSHIHVGDFSARG